MKTSKDISWPGSGWPELDAELIRLTRLLREAFAHHGYTGHPTDAPADMRRAVAR